MSKRIKKFISPFSRILPIEKLIKTGTHSFIFPFWHAVSDNPPAHLSQLYQVPTVSGFERDLDFLLKNYCPATIDDLCKFAAHSDQPIGKKFFPTFDDGLAECYHVIAPILKKKGISAAFFINPSFVNNQLLFHRHKASLILNFLNCQTSGQKKIEEAEHLLKYVQTGKNLNQFLRQSTYADHALLDQVAEIFGIDFNQYLATEKPYMTLAQIKELQEDGFIIGAHSMDHREFFLSSEDEMNNQITAGMNFLVTKINPEIKLFAFPFTDFKVPDSVFHKANLSKNWDLSFGTAGMKDEKMQKHIQRIPMESGKTTEGKLVIRTEYFWYFLKSFLGKNKVRR